MRPVVGGEWKFRASRAEDVGWMVELRAVVLRPDLERLGVFDSVRVRQRFVDAFVPEHTRVIVVDGRDVGLIAVRPESDAVWLEHFYLDPDFQGRGIGREVLTDVVSSRSTEVPLRLNVLQGSAAHRLYEKQGFTLFHQKGIDLYLQLPPRLPAKP